MTTNIIECEELIAGYVPGVNILNGCDLVVAAGEFVGIIGPNGAGKSTLMKAVLGLVTVSSGIVRLNGEDITGQPAHRLVQRGVGFVPQTNNVFRLADRPREPRDGVLRQPEVVRRSATRSSPGCSRGSANAPANAPDRSRAANDRWWRWDGR